MKRIIGFIICLLIVLAIPVCAAEEVEAVAELSTTEVIVEWVKTHIEEISVIGTLLLTIFYEIKKHGKLNISMSTLNNNAIKIAEDNSDTIKKALEEIKDVADVVTKYKEEFESMIKEARDSDETTLAHVERYLKTSIRAMKEVADEVAKMLTLANIPNSVKDEFFASHMIAVHEIEALEQEEVTSNDGKEV